MTVNGEGERSTIMQPFGLTTNATGVGVIAGLLLGVAAAAGGLTGFLIAVVLAAIGLVVGRVLDGELDLASVLSRRRDQ